MSGGVKIEVKPEEIIEAVKGMKEQKKNHWFLTVRREMAIVRE